MGVGGGGGGQETKLKPSLSTRLDVEYSSIFAADEPLSHQLQMLKLPGGKQVKIVETIAYRWQEVALALHFEGSVIASIKESTFSNVEEGCRRMLDRWLEGGCHDEPVTWERLVEALQETRFRKLAWELRTRLKY